MYNSVLDTLYHKKNVEMVYELIKGDLQKRIYSHDSSKIDSPEKECYDHYIPLLKTTKYGSPAYKKIRNEMKENGLKHHYEVNRHHPEHFENGIKDMTIIDFMEMIIDWFAASLPSDNPFIEGININCDYYHIDDMTKQLIINTYKEYFEPVEQELKEKQKL